MDNPVFESLHRQVILFFFCLKFADLLLDPAVLLLNGFQCSFMGVKRPGSDTDYTHPFSTEVKNNWSYIPSPRKHFHVVKRENFTFALLVIRNLYH
jgi:hypothetical protein